MSTEQIVAEACEQARIGVRTLQSRERTPDTVRRREVVAWILQHGHRLTQREIAHHLCRTPRQVKRMLRKLRAR